jgi:hypothetical protein
LSRLFESGYRDHLVLLRPDRYVMACFTATSSASIAAQVSELMAPQRADQPQSRSVGFPA